MIKPCKKTIAVIACAVFSIIFLVVLHFSAPEIPETPETSGVLSYTSATANPDTGEFEINQIDAAIGKDITAIRICDLADLTTITKVNYVADDFIVPDSLPDESVIVDLTEEFEFSQKGTIFLVVMNLDPDGDNFAEQAAALEQYKQGDYWHFTLHLPVVFSASNVYQKSKLAARHGEIENYDFIEFNTSYDKVTENFSAETAATTLDLQFYTRREAMTNAFGSAQIVTIHYQSPNTFCSGIKDLPTIGSEEAVKGVNDNAQNFLICFAVLSAVVFAILCALSFLKHTTMFLSAVCQTFGIGNLFLSGFLLGQTSVAPFFWIALSSASVFFTLAGAQLSIGRNFGKLPTKAIFPALSLAGALLSFFLPFVSFSVANAFHVVRTILKATGIVALVAFTVFAVFDKEVDIHTTICPMLIAVTIAFSLFAPQAFPVYLDAGSWLYALTIITTLISVFLLFTETEKANRYLTSNLHLEVERQVKDMKAIIAERDSLLRFVSHDMKKPLTASAALLETIIERERDGEQTKALRIIKQNTSRVITNLSEIGSYARFNYIAEPSQVADLYELCAGLSEFHRPDCEANGIILKNLVEKSYNVFVKRQGLENAVSNIIINAVEHANCGTITLYAKPDKKRVVLYIADDGKGIDPTIDVFRPYASASDHNETGVGLFICKNIIESMNGELSFVREHNRTVFRISLLKA